VPLHLRAAALPAPNLLCGRLLGTAAAYARRTTRLTDALELIGVALGGEAGVRPTSKLGIAAGTCPDTLPQTAHPSPVGRRGSSAKRPTS